LTRFIADRRGNVYVKKIFALSLRELDEMCNGIHSALKWLPRLVSSLRFALRRAQTPLCLLETKVSGRMCSSHCLVERHLVAHPVGEGDKTGPATPYLCSLMTVPTL
jgi:hypothetical protein